MNHLPLIRKSLCKKTSLHNAELFLSSRPSHSSSTELNIRLLKQKAKRKAIHQSELNLASKCSTSSSRLHNAELFLSSRPSHSSSTELNIRLLEQKAKRKAIHQSELNLASKCSTSSSSLNSYLARKKEREQRLHSAQIISMIK